MFKKPTTLTEFVLKEEENFPQATGSFTLLLTYIENAAKIIAAHIKKIGLVELLGSTGKKNIYQEEIKKLDQFSNDLLVNTLSQASFINSIASEEMEKPKLVNKNGRYLVFLDPLDGSSNIGINASVGTIFSIYRKKGSLLQPGKNQIAAGYIIYGSSIVFVYTAGRGVNGFTLDPSIGSFLLSHPDITIPAKGNIYSINEAYYHSYPKKIKAYLDHLKTPGKKYKSRYIGTMVSDLHRTLLKGGIFLYPASRKNPQGKLRLMFEINPFSFIIQQAGGKAVSNGKDPLEITPASVDQRAPIIIGSRLEVEKYLSIEAQYLKV